MPVKLVYYIILLHFATCSGSAKKALWFSSSLKRPSRCTVTVREAVSSIPRMGGTEMFGFDLHGHVVRFQNFFKSVPGEERERIL